MDDTLRIDWDARHRSVAMHSPGVPSIVNTGFNALGRVTRFTIGKQSPVSIAYNAHNLPAKITQFGRSLSLSYDAEARLTGYVDADGARRYLEYDEAGQLVKLMAAVIAAVAITPGAAPIVLAGAWLLVGYAAATFLYDTLKMLIDLKGIDLCNEAGLQGMGGKLADSIGDLGEELLASALLGGIGKVSGALSDAAEYAGDDAWTLWRKLKARIGRQNTVAGLCSFAGNTLVTTEVGQKPIEDIRAGEEYAVYVSQV